MSRLRVVTANGAAALCLALPGATLRAQTSSSSAPTVFEAFPGSLGQRYHFDLAKLFFPTPAVAEMDQRMLLEQLARFAKTAHDATSSADALLAALQRSDSLQGAAWRHLAYLSLRTAIDTRDRAAQAALDSLDGATDRALRSLSPPLVAVDESTLRRYRRLRPALARYEFRIESIRRERSHVLAAAEERLLSTLTPQLIDWQAALFRTTVASTPYDIVHTPEGDRDVRRNGSEIAASPSRSIREAGFHIGKRALESRREIFAFGLVNTVTGRNANARARRYADYPEQSYTERYLTADMVRHMLTALADVAESNKRYERAQIELVRRTAHFDTVHTWDLTAPEPGAAAPRFTITEASRIIRAATALLSTDYAREIAALLDPANGRLDLVPRPGRVDRQGFSTGSVGYPSTFFQGRFEGFMPDVIVLAHEGGHAVQNMLMTAAGVRPQYAVGPAYFTESFAGFNELLITDYLYRSAAEPALRRYYLRQFLNEATEVFKTARESAFEQAMYDSVAAGTASSADQFERLMQQVGARYSVWFGTDSLGRGERTMEWVNALHFFTRPLYRVNYLYAKLLALAYFDRFTRDSASFAPAYAALLRNGYDAPPDILLRHFLGVGLADPELVGGAARIIDARVAELERLTKEIQ